MPPLLIAAEDWLKNWWSASDPACFLYVGPGFEGVVAQHPPGGLRDRWPWRDPGEGAQLHPFGVKGCGIRSELSQQLLFFAVEPALTTGLLWWLVITAVLVGHGRNGGGSIPGMS